MMMMMMDFWCEVFRHLISFLSKTESLTIPSPLPSIAPCQIIQQITIYMLYMLYIYKCMRMRVCIHIYVCTFQEYTILYIFR